MDDFILLYQRQQVNEFDLLRANYCWCRCDLPDPHLNEELGD